MKVLAINGSPRGEKSSTIHILNPLLEGMRKAGAETEVVHLCKLKIQHCLGCYVCWTKTPGKCVRKDDMEWILDKFISSHIVILGTPLYHFSMSGLLKNFMERTLPLNEPWLVESSHIPGVTTHPQRAEKPVAMALVSPCGFPEFEHFKPLVEWFRYYVKEGGKKNLGEILRPSAEGMSREEMQGMFAPYYEIVKIAGEEMITKGAIAEEINEKLKMSLFQCDAETFRKRANDYWKKSIEAGK